MPSPQTHKKVSLDATGKSLGRLASEVASLLRGKDLPEFEPHQVIKRDVEVVNIKAAKVTPKKGEELYHHHTGYPGGLKTTTLQTLWQKSPRELFRKIVTKMLPGNRLRKLYLKNLKFKETANDSN